MALIWHCDINIKKEELASLSLNKMIYIVSC